MNLALLAESASTYLEEASPETIIAWTVKHFGDKVVVASSFEDCVLVDIATKVDPQIEVIFLDTGFHFEETLAYVGQVSKLLNLNLRIVRPSIPLTESPCGSDLCCQVRKVQPLLLALSGKDAWITGLKRVDSPTRSATPVVAYDSDKGKLKVNPLINWTDEDIISYLHTHDLPAHPLWSKGYTSIGCAPTTRPPLPGEGRRSGRWAGTSKTECGLHT
jgi:phosphoadenosine phosphosulfate reductase